MHDFDTLAGRLTPHYSRFKVADRLLFTGHSHQAWPDVALNGMTAYFDKAAEFVDGKWEDAFNQVELLREYLRDWYDDPNGYYCHGQNTHVLLTSWLSALDLKHQPKIVTTDGEFHSMQRQLHRLKEEGVQIEAVEINPLDTFLDRLADYCGPQTAALMLSRVFYETSVINPYLREIGDLARERGIPLLIDDYHGTNVSPISLREEGLDDCFLVTGGYKYLQWGEGNCFLRFPRDCQWRPVVTGWFASFTELDHLRNEGQTHYDDGNQRFANATYDPVSQYRAAKVINFFRRQGLSKLVLEQQYSAQIEFLYEAFLKLDLDPKLIRLAHDQPLSRNGGFLALTTPYAAELCKALKSHGVSTDSRGDVIRFGVAPYLRSSQIDEAMSILEKCVPGL